MGDQEACAGSWASSLHFSPGFAVPAPELLYTVPPGSGSFLSISNTCSSCSGTFSTSCSFCALNVPVSLQELGRKLLQSAPLLTYVTYMYTWVVKAPVISFLSDSFPLPWLWSGTTENEVKIAVINNNTPNSLEGKIHFNPFYSPRSMLFTVWDSTIHCGGEFLGYLSKVCHHDDSHSPANLHFPAFPWDMVKVADVLQVLELLLLKRLEGSL